MGFVTWTIGLTAKLVMATTLNASLQNTE